MADCAEVTANRNNPRPRFIRGARQYLDKRNISLNIFIYCSSPFPNINKAKRRGKKNLFLFVFKDASRVYAITKNLFAGLKPGKRGASHRLANLVIGPSEQASERKKRGEKNASKEVKLNVNKNNEINKLKIVSAASEVRFCYSNYL